MSSPTTLRTADQQARLLEAVYAVQFGGASAAQSILIELAQPRLQRFCLNLCRNPELAQDLCQDAWIRIFRSIAGLREPHQFMAWAMRIIKNLFINHIGRAGTRFESAIDFSEEGLEPVSSGDLESELDLGLSVRGALERLRPEDQAALLAIDLGGASYAEAAREFRISPAALRSRISRARARMCAELEREAA